MKSHVETKENMLKGNFKDIIIGVCRTISNTHDRRKTSGIIIWSCKSVTVKKKFC